MGGGAVGRAPRQEVDTEVSVFVGGGGVCEVASEVSVGGEEVCERLSAL